MAMECAGYSTPLLGGARLCIAGMTTNKNKQFFHSGWIWLNREVFRFACCVKYMVEALKVSQLWSKRCISWKSRYTRYSVGFE
jgi:hypothetical protein